MSWQKPGKSKNSTGYKVGDQTTAPQMAIIQAFGNKLGATAKTIEAAQRKALRDKFNPDKTIKSKKMAKHAAYQDKFIQKFEDDFPAPEANNQAVASEIKTNEPVAEVPSIEKTLKKPSGKNAKPPQ